MLNRSHALAVAVLLLLAPGLICAQDHVEDSAVIVPPGSTNNVEMAQGAPKQDDAALPHLKLVFRTLEVNPRGEVNGSKVYMTVIAANDLHITASIRNQDQIAVERGSGQYTQYEYRQVGAQFDIHRATLHQKQFAAVITAHLTDLVAAPETPPQNAARPTIRENIWDSDVAVPLGVPTVIFSSQHTSNPGKTELELTATEIKQP